MVTRLAIAPVVAEKSVKVEVREHVAVHRDERVLSRPSTRRSRGGRAERLRLARVYAIRTESSVRFAKNRLDQVRQIADAERDVRDPACSELAEHELQNGAIAYRHQRLR